MAYIRWLHKSWNVFWTFIGVLVLTIAIVFGAAFGLMQLQPVKDRVAVELQDRFSQNFEGVLSIGELDGLLPLRMQMSNVKIYPDSSEFEPVFETNAINASLDVWSLLRNRVVINALEIEAPMGIIDPKSDFSLDEAFKLKTALPARNNTINNSSGSSFQIIIPSVVVQNGNFIFRNAFERPNRLSSADSMNLQNVQMDMFFEFTEDQRFVDINQIKFDIPEFDIPSVELFGQVYNDSRFLELNALNVRVGNSTGRFSGEAEGVNLLEGRVKEQIINATLNMQVDRLSLESSYITRFFPDIPELQNTIRGSVMGEGTLDSLYFSNAELSVGDSFADLNGYVRNLRSSRQFSYNINLEAAVLGQNELQLLNSKLTPSQLAALTSTRFEGEVSGTKDSTATNIIAENIERGRFEIDGVWSWSDQIGFDLTFNTDSLDLGNLIDPRIQSTDLTLNGEIKSSSLNFRESKGGLVIRSEEGVFDKRNFNQVSILANWDRGLIEPDIRAEVNGALLTTNGTIDLSTSIPSYSLNGEAGNIFLNEIVQDNRMREVYADLEYDVNLRGKEWNDLFGQVSLDITRAVAGEDTLGRHQLYMDFNEPDARQRILRLTSSAFDATVQGDFVPADVLTLSKQWTQYFKNRVREEFTFDSLSAVRDSTQILRNQSLTISGRLKNLGLIKSYFPDFPVIKTSARINSTINVNSQRLLFNATFVDTETGIRNFDADSLMVQATGGFRRDASLKDFSGLQFQADAAQIDYYSVKGRNFDFSANFNQDSVEVRSSIQQLAEDASFLFHAGGEISEDALTLFIHDFMLGTDTFQWANAGTPMLQYQSNEKLKLRDFVFESDSQFVQVNGTFSSATEDSVDYNIADVNLARLSDLIGGRIRFGGIVNGKFTTRTLTTVPTIQGEIDVEALNLDNTLFGDILLTSRYNSSLDRFDTNITVSTDSAKYPQYFANNDRKGQNFEIDGYVLAPKEGNFPDVDSLYQFDIDFENIDLWILPYIGPKVFAEASGLANGTGKIWGNLQTYDFESDFMVGIDDAAYIRPEFLDTYYYAQGNLTFTRNDGFTFNDIYFIDPSGGSAILSGYYDLNDFGPSDSLRISLEMDEFQFLNSTFDPTVAFFGQAYGSSTVTISGTNMNPVLRTEQPIVISDFSQISIPLLEETEFNEDNRFIRFVNSFDMDDIRSGMSSTNNRNRINGVPGQSEEELTFAERFTLDLQFVASNPMTVQLIFDPVTGDIVTADGTGRLRILLEDEQVSMFGRFDITGGSYQFVSGDIFTRRFELEQGGTIIWEGDPANARLNLNAIYRARPDINTLSNTGTRDPANAQRVPVELVLNIGGTISGIENNFFFRLPDTFESQQSSTLSTQLASINRDENLKLIQATNFMLMGDFIPVSSAGDPQGNPFGENLSGSAAVLNPLLSSQVINPLLSNQVNSLLNSDLSSLDVDFNLNTYNQVDLGVALRLYNDKIILRREGQITGRQSNIGDLGATYRINRTFAVTAFHRQDLTFGTISSTEQSQQSQEINGVGLEAKVTFNTWDEFFNRLLSPFKKLFGVKEKEQNQEEITENIEGQDPT
ncbi:hypothetical protein [Gracilimonas sp.]|uniref:translocation/assembly module TamB domain-containing protein n=1 Tax=Gracilimonas sp. TaxID=1974203 RepID=UPI0032EC2B86